MDGNEIVLSDGDQVPRRQRLEIVLSILDPPGIRGQYAVLVERFKRGGDIKDGKVMTTEFTHSLVEIVRTRKIWLRPAESRETASRTGLPPHV
jgi:hypothetical protein